MLDALYQRIFNLQDLFLFYLITLCFLFAILLLISESEQEGVSNRLLAAFLVSVALSNIDSILYWHDVVSPYLLARSSHYYFNLGFSALLVGPCLYLYTKSLTTGRGQLRRKDYWHFLPAALHPILILLAYHMQDETYRTALVTNYDLLTANWTFEVINWFRRITVVAYAVLAFLLVERYQRHLVDTHSEISNRDLSWLRLLNGGFAVFWSVLLIAVLEDRYSNFELGPVFGHIEGILQFVLLNVLIFYVLKKGQAFAGLHQKARIKDSKEEPQQTDSQPDTMSTDAKYIRQFMQEQKPFLKPTMTLERLSEQVKIPPRRLSNLINQEFKQNFYEFINGYRVEEAKRLLIAPEKRGDTIQTIMQDAGFYSKSTFNNLFKKNTNMTPKAFRSQGQAEQVAKAE